MKDIIFVLLFSILISQFANAQVKDNPISLKDVLNLVENEHILLKQQQGRIEFSKARINSAGQWSDLEVELQQGQINFSEQDYALSVMQNFGSPFLQKAEKNLRTEEVKLEEINFLMQKRILFQEITLKYYEWLYLQKKIELFEVYITDYQNAIKEAKEETDSLDLTLLSISNQAREIALAFQNLQKEKELTANEFNNLLYLEDFYIPLENENWEFDEGDVLIDNNSLQENPLLLQSDIEYSISTKNLEVERKSRSLKFALGAFIQQIQNETGFTGLFFGLEIPIWSKAYKANISQAKIEQDIQKQEREYVNFLLNNQVLEYQERINLIQNNIIYRKTILIPEKEKILQQAKVLYEENNIDFSDYLSYLGSLFETKLEQLEEEFSLHQEKIRLHYLLSEESY